METPDIAHCYKNQKVMTKMEIVNKIVKSTGLPTSTVLATVELLIETIKDSLIKGENVYLRGFGSFMVKRRQAKAARIIKTGERIIVPAHNLPVWLPSPEFKGVIAKGINSK